jgi:hypothetical protein
MRRGILIALIAISTSAFAGEVKNQSNVYDDFRRWMEPSSNATVDEEVTAIIKRDMANLLYPVDMSSFSRPDTDPKFRDQIIVLQQEMGVSPTGVLTVDQFDRLAEASRNINGDHIGSPEKMVSMGEDGSWLSAAGTRAGDDIPHPINFVRIFCYRARGTCERYEATFDEKARFLYLDVGNEYTIDTWTPSRVTARINALCATFIMTIDVKGEQVTTVTVPQPDSSRCVSADSSPRTWKLVDAFPVAWKLNQDRMNRARTLVYPPAKRLMPIQQ